MVALDVMWYLKLYAACDRVRNLDDIISINADNVAINWMPAHLDDPSNKKKLDRYLNRGGSMRHVEGNASADASAKRGAVVRTDASAHAQVFV